jgi:hypothetical protein
VTRPPRDETPGTRPPRHETGPPPLFTIPLPKDDREAARLYKLAADQGLAYAQFNLGVFYENACITLCLATDRRREPPQSAPKT